MSRGKEIEGEQCDQEEIAGDEDKCEYAVDEDDCEGDLEDPCQPYTFECYVTKENSSKGPRIFSDGPSSEKMRKYYTSQCLDRNQMFSSGSHGEPEDADYSILPQCSDELEAVLFPRIPIELETMILARTGILEYKKLSSLSKRISQVIGNGDLLKERRMNGIREVSVFMLASGEENWRAFNQQFTMHKSLPRLPSDDVFKSGDKESLCAGTHLLVCGHDFGGPVIWTYEAVMDEWYKGPSMVEHRCLFASASCGDFAYAAGGIGLETNDVLCSAEKYDPVTKSWDLLPKMKEERKMCAGAYMDNKIYVVGGQDKNGDGLTCAEVFDLEKKMWVKIPGMLNGLTTSQSPPLLAVVNNDLYLFETSSNSLMVYLKDCNSWKNVGPVPVRADLNRGWGIAFKSLGNELLVIGSSNISPSGRGIYTCCPNPNSENQKWVLRDGSGESNRSHFIMNCTIMVA